MQPLPDQAPAGPVPEAAAETDGFAPRDARHLTILLVARVITAAGDALARVRNISNGGSMLETSLPLDPGDAVRIELRSVQAVEGRVAWAMAPRAGVQFDAPADVKQLLHPAIPQGYVPRPPRLATHCLVQLCHNGRLCRATLLDLSQGGGHIQSARPMAVGDPVTLSIPGIGACKAVVRWVRGEDAGLIFLDAICFAELDRWFQNRALRFAGQSEGG